MKASPQRWFLFGIALLVLAASIRFVWRSFRSERSYVRDEVPAALPLFDAKRVGFAANEGGPIETRGSEKSAHDGGPSLLATAPPLASGAFALHRLGGLASATVHLRGVAASNAKIENGHVVYRSAYDDVDVVAFADADSLELAYVVRASHPPDRLGIGVDRADGDALREEPSTHALLLEDRHHRVKLRITQPMATDANGNHRAGHYDIDGGDIRLAFDWSGMATPVVIDPSFSLPFWSILNDGRVPASAVYDPVLQSRESHMTYDSARGRAILVRPERSQLDTDTLALSGNQSNSPIIGTLAVGSSVPRSQASLLLPSGAATADWQRGFDLESETWEWNGSLWSLVDSARLPGLVDPALTFDAARARTVLFGGALPSALQCFTTNFNQLVCSAFLQDATATYEYDGTLWTVKRVPNSPPPRLRAAMAWSSALGKTVLFGGRVFGRPSESYFAANPEVVPVSPIGPPYPENLTQDLLNDTWTYDGTSWTPIFAGTPPPPTEGAQLVEDVARGVLVLVGGHTDAEVAPNVDRFGIWEFDGVDWAQKIPPADPSKPVSIATRYGASAFYNAVRKRVTVLGGNVAKLDFCALSDAAIAAQLAAAQNDAAALKTLQATGCLGGFVHDAWEWDGSTLAKVTDVVFGGTVGTKPVFEQVGGETSWALQGAAGEDAGAPVNGPTSLLSYRFDDTSTHFPLRTELERAHLSDAGAAPPASASAGAESAETGTGVSPLFAARMHPDTFFDTARGVATLLTPDTGVVYTTDGAAWSVGTARTPFSNGPNDFLATVWDTVHQRVVAFDPRDGSTWVYTDAAGWSPLAVSGTGPGAWSVDPSIHAKRDFVRVVSERASEGDAAGLLAALPQLPVMTFDRSRGRVVLLYAQATWEFDGTAWTSHPYPPTWAHCVAGRLAVYDGIRNRTVAFGCNVPADTWEWDGTTWVGPGPSPYAGTVERDANGLLVPVSSSSPDWVASLQLAWSHPNAAFESPTLGGASMIDSDGTLRTWNGSTWKAGAQIPDLGFCKRSIWTPTTSGLHPSSTVTGSSPYPVNTTDLLGRQLLPMCFGPPAIEDAANGRLLAFRDGPNGMLELPLGGPAAPTWDPVGTLTALNPGLPSLAAGAVAANPYPFELMAPEMLHVFSQSDPATRTGALGTPTGVAPAEKAVAELWWPYHLVVDPAAHRVRMITNRGAVWEITGEPLQGLGGGCKSDLDCAIGSCGTEGVCCDRGKACTQFPCMTCLGSLPGICQAVPAGLPDPTGICGTGACVGICVGGNSLEGIGPSCSYNPAVACGPAPTCSAGTLSPGGHCAPNGPACLIPGASLPTCPVTNGKMDESSPCIPASQPCAGGLACADANTCKGGSGTGGGCASRADCASPYSDCNTLTGTCSADVASQLATKQGVTPAAVKPPPRLTNDQIASALADAGFSIDDAGRFAVGGPDDTNSTASFMFDPNLHKPWVTFRNCMEYIETCMVMNKDIDSCVAQAPRCATPTPWLGDPAGIECCPQACLVTYFNQRPAASAAVALQTVARSACYLPGANGGAPAGGSGDGGTP